MLRNITKILLDKQINILGSVANDSAEYGIIRMVVSDPDEAVKAFREAGFMCRVTDVIGVEVQDEVGNLDRMLNALSESNINVDYIYLSYSRQSGLPIMVFSTEDCYEVEECLISKGFRVL